MLAPAERKKLLAERDSWEDKSRAFRGQGKFAEAIAALERAMTIERRVFGEDSDEVAKSLDYIGSFQLARDDFPAARKAFQQLQTILLKLHDKNDWHLVDVRLNLEDLEIHEHLTPAARKELALGEQVDGQALTAFRNGEFAQAIKLEQQALEIRQRILGDGNVNTGNSRLKLATLYSWTGEYAKAEKCSLDALAVSRKVKGNAHPDTAQNLNNLAGLYEDMDEYAKAERLHLEALSIWTKALGEAHPNTAVCMNDTALLYKSMGQYAKAEEFLKKALKIQKDNQGLKHRDTAVTMNNFGELYRDMGEYAKAEPLFLEAVGIEKDILGEKHPLTGTTINNLASLYTAVGDTAKAEPLLKQAIELHTKGYGEFHPNTAMSYENLGYLYETIHDYVRAESAYRRALAIDHKVLGDEHPKTAEMLTNVAAIERLKGDYAKAETFYRQALDIDKKVVGESSVITVQTIGGLALVYESQGQFAKEEPLLRKALETSTKVRGEKHPATVNLLNHLAFVYTATGEAQRAEPLSRRALEISEKYFDDSLRGQSERRQLALAHTLRSSLDAYLTYSAQASAADVYRHVLGWKGAVFMGQLASRAMRHRPDLERLFDELEVVSARLSTMAMRGPKEKLRATWERQVAELSDRKEALERDLSSKSDEFRQDKSLLQMDPGELQRALPPGVALIDYLEYQHSSMPASGHGLRIHEPRLVAFVVRKDKPIERFELGPIAAVSTAIDAWRKNLQGDLNQPAEASARFSGPPDQYLKARLWSPLQKSLAGSTTVLVSPDGVLNQIPLAALPGEKPGTYLLEERTLVNVPVPRLQPFLLTHRKRGSGAPPNDYSMLLVGNVQYGADPGHSEDVMVAGRSAVRGGDSAELSFVELPGSATESTAIQESFMQQFHESQFKMLARDQATEAAFRRAAPHYRYMHLATHGFFAPRSVASALSPAAETPDSELGAFGRQGIRGSHPGLLSGIALSGANGRGSKGGDDGILTAVEVADLDLERAELVVLSACETGLGAVAGGEGVLGLQRAFQIAGARNVVASLWKVDDRATAQLMKLFYHKLWTEKKTPALALREAQLWILNHPDQSPSAVRGLDFDKVGQLPGTGRSAPSKKRMPPYFWAGFVISGAGL